MLIHRLYDDDLAQASYLVACETTGEAIVVDPNLELDRYLRAAEAERVRITCVTETHIHAHFVSGARALARGTGARLLLSGEGGPEWQYAFAKSDGATLLRDGDLIEVGRVRLDVLHTPGHTPEHLAFLATDTASADRPMGMFTGDFVFVGDVGRPDLLERAAGMAGTMHAAAKQLFRSLQRLHSLPDYLQLWPGHGAGSACGKALGAVPQTTLGYERMFNAALRQADEDTFVRDILAGQPEPPRYFARMKRVNRDGPPVVAEPPAAVPRVEPDAVESTLRRGACVIDTRLSADFIRAFVPGTICVPRSRSFLGYFGAVAPEQAPVLLLVARQGDVAPLARSLRLIGFDELLGWAPADGVVEARRKRGQPIGTLESADVQAVRAHLADGRPPTLLDVRTAAERQFGQIPGARAAYLGNLNEATADLPCELPIIVYCQGGTRAVIGASLLVAKGFHHVTPMIGGVDAWHAAGLPLVTPS